MLISLLISQNSDPIILQSKIDRLVSQHDYYLGYDYEFLTTVERVNFYIRDLKATPNKRGNGELIINPNTPQILILSLRNIQSKIKNPDDEIEKLKSLITAA